MQEILKKFKLNENLIYEYKNWYLVLRGADNVCINGFDRKEI